MNSEFWQEKWKTGETQFHRDTAHPELVAYFSGKPVQKIVVPLCGKSKDLLWLHSQGHEVVGIELSPIACEAFFVENQLPFEKQTSPEGTVYQGDRVSLWCIDFFQTPARVWAGCHSIYDRAALIALPTEMRQRYSQHLIKSWDAQKPENGTMLVITLEYTSEKSLGPPFSVTGQEVRALYSGKFDVKLLNSQREESLSGRPPKFTGVEVTECTYELSF